MGAGEPKDGEPRESSHRGAAAVQLSAECRSPNGPQSLQSQRGPNSNSHSAPYFYPMALALSSKGANRAGLTGLRMFPDIKHEGSGKESVQ